MATVSERAAEVMEHLCSHSDHGYSQPNRAGIGTGGGVGEVITLSDGSTVGISYGDRDCSSAVIECYAALGVNCGGATYTGNMRSCMCGTGNFSWGTSLSSLVRGDILLNEAHHTALYLGDGKVGQFSISETGGVSGQRGDQTGYESNVRSYYDYPWDGVLRYVGEDSGTHDVIQPPMQETSGKLVIDCLWGSATTMLAQIVVDAPWHDGIVSRQNPAHKLFMPGCTTGWEWDLGDGSGSPLIMALQKIWGAEPDGIMGPDTINKMIAYYMKLGSGATVCDGKLDLYSPTIGCFQQRLNEGTI